MQASDIMTRKVVTVAADTSVRDIAALLLKHRISAVPVLGDEQAVIGLVSEGDLVRRVGADGEKRNSWWLEFFQDPANRAADYVKIEGRHARDVMTREVVTVPEDMPIGRIARLLERRRIKRVPVVRAGKLVGIVSRGNLLQGLASAPDAAIPVPGTDDRALRDLIMARLAEVPGISVSLVNITVQDGNVAVWGATNSDIEERAVRVAVENVPGVGEIELQLGRVPAWAYGI